MESREITFSIDRLIEIVRHGGKAKTGIDIYNRQGVLLLGKNVLVETPKPLLIAKKNGIRQIPINPENAGGVWTRTGLNIDVSADAPAIAPAPRDDPAEKRKYLCELKGEASKKYDKAKENIKKVIQDIRRSGGEFDYDTVESTVTDLFSFIMRHDTAFSCLTREIFSYDDYLYHHSINVCTLGTAVMKKVNEQSRDTALRFSPRASFQTAIGLFLHDVGKVLIPRAILNKPGRLTAAEFELIKTHSFEKGMRILQKNRITDPRIADIVTHHHSAIINDEPRCYPADRTPADLPPAVKICKLADIYDAMTSKRAYKEAVHPAKVVAELVRNYAQKDAALQPLLRAFVNLVGIYPAGSIVVLSNHQMAYVLDSEGPLVVPLSDPNGNWLKKAGAPVNLSHADAKARHLGLDYDRPLLPPARAFELMPETLRRELLN